MASAVEIRDAVDQAVLDRLTSNAIDEYSMQDGRDIKHSSLTDLMKVREVYASQAIIEEQGGPLMRARFALIPMS